MLAWLLCDFSGDLDQYCLETQYFQGRRRLLKVVCTAIERLRRSPSGEGTSGGRARGGYVPLSLGGLGDLPHEKFVIEDD